MHVELRAQWLQCWEGPVQLAVRRDCSAFSLEQCLQNMYMHVGSLVLFHQGFFGRTAYCTVALAVMYGLHGVMHFPVAL